MIEKYNRILINLREGRIDIKDFLFEEGKDDKGHSYDLNSNKRFQLLKALQYNRANSDENILLELFDAEIESHRKATFQGLHTALKLNAYLLSQFQKPEYSKLFLNAKQANFDTHCGFDYQYLVSAGISETYKFIKSQPPEIAESFKEYVGNTINDCYISEAELENWKQYLKEEFPQDLIIEGILDEIGLAIELNEKEILSLKISEWQNSKQTWNESDLNQLSYYKSVVNDFEGQIWANEELLKYKSSHWDRASYLLRLSELLLKTGQSKKAWNKIEESHNHLNNISEWWTVGLGRFIVENAFDIVLKIDNSQDKVANEAFNWASKEVRRMNDLHLNLLEKTAKAGDLMGDIKLKDQFTKTLKIEKEKLDRILNQRNPINNDSEFISDKMQSDGEGNGTSFWSKLKKIWS